MAKNKPYSISLLTLFPEMFPGPLGHSLAGKALEQGLWQYNLFNLQNYATELGIRADDAPFGGGAGMVLRVDVIGRAMEDVAPGLRPLLYMTPRGRVMTQKEIELRANQDGLVILCGRYEGVDQRAIDHYGFEEVSMGDYILSGGEIAALALMDACLRLREGITGNELSLTEESFSRGSHLLEYPHYTRPSSWQGREVPGVLLSGHHDDIRKWRTEQAEKITKERKPELWRLHREQNSAKEKEGGSS